MRIVPTNIRDLLALHIKWDEDSRGRFGRLFCREEFSAMGLVDEFVQISRSVTRRAGTLRGLHLQQSPHSETKLVSCVRGAIYDVVVDLRSDSPSYLSWQAFEISQDDNLALYIPKGCAHGFQTLVDNCEVLYQMDTPYAPDYANGVRYDDPAVGIVWPLAVSVISEKDLSWPFLAVGSTEK